MQQFCQIRKQKALLNIVLTSILMIICVLFVRKGKIRQKESELSMEVLLKNLHLKEQQKTSALTHVQAMMQIGSFNIKYHFLLFLSTNNKNTAILVTEKRINTDPDWPGHTG